MAQSNLLEERRLALHAKLVDLLGSNHVYFQPPESIKMEYPCIVYKRSTGDTKFANNHPYTFQPRYTVTIITKDPDSELIRKMAFKFPMCRLNRHFTTQNLNHDSFDLYW